jgi:hypothetical protein
MAEYAEMAYADDGNDQRDQYDTFGFANGDDLVLDLYAAAGMKLISRNADDEYYYSYGNDEETVEVMTSILEDVMYQDFFWNSWLTRNEVSDQPSFKKDQSLFSQGMAKSCNSFRDMESAYGILPVPKYDESQEDYSSLVWMHHDCVLGIPASCTNTDIISTVLEHMSYISYYDVYPIFYDTIILGKSARDQQSKEMLELIFKTRAFDPGQYWLAESTGPFLTLFEQKKTNISSVWAGAVNQVESELEDFNEKIDELK